jgi:phospholipid/cholesterol/gamma-HCH transport system substrate-binding protein
MIITRSRIVALAVIAVLGSTAAAKAGAVAEDNSIEKEVVAQFASAAPLVVNNEVKIDGVVVGKVHSLDVDKGFADVGMSLDPSAFPLHRDARATIRSVSLLGERYVDLERGNPSAPLLEQGDPIPLTQTRTNVGADEIFNVLDKPTSAGLAAFFTTLGDGLRDNGGNADAAIRALAPALRDTQGLTKVLRDQNALLNALVDRAEPVANALATDDGKAMDRMVGAADRLLGATASQDAALNRTLDELPSALESARTSLGSLKNTANGATPTLRGMRPFTDNLDNISNELMLFSDSLDPALASLDPVLDRARDLLDKAEPVVSDLHHAGPGFRTTTESIRPIAKDLTSNLDNVLNFVRNWALTTNGSDGLSHYFRAHYTISPAAVTGFVPGGNPLPNTVPGMRRLPPVPGLLEPSTGDHGRLPDAGQTGLNPAQERGMAGFLLGGGS